MPQKYEEWSANHFKLEDYLFRMYRISNYEKMLSLQIDQFQAIEVVASIEAQL